jgi:hypothetical protein
MVAFRGWASARSCSTCRQPPPTLRTRSVAPSGGSNTSRHGRLESVRLGDEHGALDVVENPLRGVADDESRDACSADRAQDEEIDLVLLHEARNDHLG